MRQPKLLITTDIGGDPDDQQSLVRLLAFSNAFDIVGLIASASGTPADKLGPITHPEIIAEVVDAYAACRPNLALHADGYPAAEALREVIRSGNPQRGMNHVGAGHATAGSEQIIRAGDAATAEHPVHIAIWGGATELAQALFDVRAGRTAAQTAAFIACLRVYAIDDQDATSATNGTGRWINEQFPQLFYILATHGNDAAGAPIRCSAPFRGMYANAVLADDRTSPRQLMPDDQMALSSRAWLDRHVAGHGALGEVYPMGPSERYRKGIWQGPTGVGFVGNDPHAGMKEGDTPSWFFCFDNGLNDPVHPENGGWGGRFVQHDPARPLFTAARDAHWGGNADIAMEQAWTVARWRAAYQREFAARMSWVAAPSYAAANHPPVAPRDGPLTAEITVQDDSTIEIATARWTHPHEYPLSYRWWLYQELSTLDHPPLLRNCAAPTVHVTVPPLRQPGRFHLILEVTDQPPAGQIAFTRYQRVQVTVMPARAAGRLLVRQNVSAE